MMFNFAPILNLHMENRAVSSRGGGTENPEGMVENKISSKFIHFSPL